MVLLSGFAWVTTSVQRLCRLYILYCEVGEIVQIILSLPGGVESHLRAVVQPDPAREHLRVPYDDRAPQEPRVRAVLRVLRAHVHALHHPVGLLVLAEQVGHPVDPLHGAQHAARAREVAVAPPRRPIAAGAVERRLPVRRAEREAAVPAHGVEVAEAADALLQLPVLVGIADPPA